MTMDIVREYHVAAFRGKVEDVPIAEGVDVEALRLRDDDLVFVSLPIAEIGAISNNGLLYDEALVDSIAEQINTKRPGGIFGHLKDEERSTSFPLPSGLWVGAKRFGETLWAKAYVPPSEARKYVLNLKSVGGELATSIYGRGKYEKVRDGVKRLTGFKLESLDFAPPGRAALGMGAIPYVTAELEHNQETNEMSVDKKDVIAELRDVTVPPQKGWLPVVEQGEATVAELSAQLSARDDRITVLETTVQEFQRREFVRAVDEVVAELTNWTVSDSDKDANGKTSKDKLASLRAMLKRAILERVGDEKDVESVAEIATAAWEDIRPIAEMVRDALAGPAAVVAGKPRDNARPPLEDTPENRAKAMSRMGISV